MSDDQQRGVLYTNHVRQRAGTPLLSLWSFINHVREPNRRPVTKTAEGDMEFWLDRTDPLLNSILPGTAASIVCNFGGDWASGKSLVATAIVPRASLIGPFTRPHVLRVGPDVRAIGAVLPIAMAAHMFRISADELIDRIIPLDDAWSRVDRIDQLVAQILEKMRPPVPQDEIVVAAIDRIKAGKGSVTIDALADASGITRQQFSRRFRAATGLSPKVYARLTRFQALISALLVNDVSQWASVSTELGFTDQAHMINEFHTLAGQSPIQFFRPHGDHSPADHVKVKGRPSEWLRPGSSQ